MTDAPASADLRSVVLEREFPHPPSRLWRALTQPHLMAEWLMRTDFAPEPGRRFQLHGDWGSVDCRVLEIEPERTLAYSWDALGLESVVTFTLTPTAAGVRLRVEQAGFRPEQKQAFAGARFGWTRMLDTLDAMLARAD